MATAPRRGPRLPAGWPIVAGGFLIMLVSGMLWNSFGLFLVALQAEFGWSRGEISFGFTLFTLANAASSPLVGWCLRRADARLVLGLLSLCLVLGLLGTSRATTLAGFYVSFGLVCGIGAQSCSSFALFTILGNWFHGRATLLSIADSGSGIGAFIGLPLLLALMQAESWRVGYLALAGAAALVILPLNALLMRFGPPAPRRAAGAAAAASTPVTPAPSRPALGWLAVAFFLGPVAYQALLTQQIALFHDQGIETELAVWIAAAAGLTIFACRFVAGWLVDRMGAMAVLGGGLVGAVLTVACLELLLGWGDRRFLQLYPILLGIGFGAQAIVLAGGTRMLVPGADFAFIFGTMRLVGGLGIATGPALAGTIFDLSGSYQLALLVILVAVVGQYAAFRAALGAVAAKEVA
jgi:MFS family permease